MRQSTASRPSSGCSVQSPERVVVVDELAGVVVVDVEVVGAAVVVVEVSVVEVVVEVDVVVVEEAVVDVLELFVVDVVVV